MLYGSCCYHLDVDDDSQHVQEREVMPFGGYNPLDDGEYEDFSPWGPRREPLITEKRLHEIIDQAGFRVDGDEVLSCYREGVDISDNVMTLIKLVAEECADLVGHFEYGPDGEQGEWANDVIKAHFGLG
jgi:ribosomal protein S16